MAANLKSLTGLRFYAAAGVVLLHATRTFVPDSPLDFPFRLGAVGVSLFFVLSGFVLTWSHKSATTKRAFYQNRFARIYPLHLLTWTLMFVLLAASAQLPTPLQTGTTLLLVQAWVPDPAVFFALNGPSWSLSDEFFFYLVFPFLLALVHNLAVRALVRTIVGVVAVVAVLTVVAHVLLQDGPSVALLYVNPAYRVWEFAVGILVARLVQSGWRPPLKPTFYAVLLVVAYATLSALNYGLVVDWGPLGALPMMALPNDLASLVLVPAIAMLIASIAVQELGGVTSHLGGRVLVSLGKWSFALYMCHLFIVEGAKSLFGTEHSLLVGGLIVVTVFIASQAIAWLLYRYVEMPAERALRARGSGRRVD